MNFRNYKSLSVNFDNRINIILGNNAQGKSNLLESIYLLSMGKSFRTIKDTEMIRFNEDFLRVKGVFIKKEEELSLEIIFKNKEKRFKINGLESVKNADLLENAYIVVFSPEDIQIIKEEPERRRKYLDRELFLIRPLYFRDMSRYKKSLLQRNSILKEEFPDASMLDVWDDNLIYYGLKIIRERKRFIEKLKIESREIYYNICGRKETFELRYEPNIEISDEINKQESSYKRILSESRGYDLSRKTTTRGPHKDDFSMFINGIDVRRFGSQGQQRTAALALKLAELMIIKEETGEEAIVILDDVLSELDKERQHFLIDSLFKSQIFISAAEINNDIRDAFAEGKFFYINKGEVSYK